MVCQLFGVIDLLAVGVKNLKRIFVQLRSLEQDENKLKTIPF